MPKPYAITVDMTAPIVDLETMRRARNARPATPSKLQVVAAAKLMSGPQLRIMKVLVRHKSSLTRNEINEGAAKDGFPTAMKFSAWITEPLGQEDAAARKSAEAKTGKKSLISLGFVAQKKLEIEEGVFEVRYEATDKGREAYRTEKS